MHPEAPAVIPFRTHSEPNLEIVRRLGWAVKSSAGRYCVAWRGADEIILVWRNDHWERVGGGELREAA